MVKVAPGARSNPKAGARSQGNRSKQETLRRSRAREVAEGAAGPAVLTVVWSTLASAVHYVDS
jgi:hypothetical protein